jgi:predicted nuclease of restriction endonuclease-like (RecB) superfamily
MKKKATAPPAAKLLKAAAQEVLDASFGEVLHLIQTAKQRAYQAVNTELVSLYWQVGEYISRKLESAEWGDKVVDELACFLARTQPGLKGFTRPNLFRMRQFYMAYRNNSIVSALLRQLPWTHHMIILSRSKLEEEREFYIRLALYEKWSSRELERQFNTARFERTILKPLMVSPLVAQLHPQAAEFFKDNRAFHCSNTERADRTTLACGTAPRDELGAVFNLRCSTWYCRRGYWHVEGSRSTTPRPTHHRRLSRPRDDAVRPPGAREGSAAGKAGGEAPGTHRAGRHPRTRAQGCPPRLRL